MLDKKKRNFLKPTTKLQEYIVPKNTEVRLSGYCALRPSDNNNIPQNCPSSASSASLVRGVTVVLHPREGVWGMTGARGSRTMLW